MFAHHRAAIQALAKQMAAREDVRGVLVCGSVAHSCAMENSDVDVKIICAEPLYQALRDAGRTEYFDRSATHYEGGYIDGEYICAQTIRHVARRGTEPMRYDYQNAIVALDKDGTLPALAALAARYPAGQKQENLRTFFAQFCAWKWYYYEALQRDNRYLAQFSALRFAHFGGRLLLAYNERLYPWHKWFLHELAAVPRKPNDLMRCMNALIEQKRAEDVERLYNMISDFYYWPREKRTTRQMMRELVRAELDEAPFAAGR